MKRIAAILFFIFALVQAGPAVQTLVNPDQVTLFIVDEEKNNIKEDQSKSFKSYCSANNFAIFLVASKTANHFITIERLSVSPYLGNHTPPPNYS